MGCSFVVCLMFGLTGVAADPKALDVTAEKTNLAAALIAKWDDMSVDVRDQATTELKKMGREALPALVAAANKKPSSEVQARLREVLPAARAADFEARYPFFLADTFSQYDHNFLGWTELKAAVKDTKDSRLLFRDILEEVDCRDMLLLAAGESKADRERFEERWETKRVKWCRARPLNAGEPMPGEPIGWLAAALLADLIYDRDYKTLARTHMVGLYTQYTDEGVQLRVVEGRHGMAVIDLARRWVERQEGEWGKRDAEYIAKDFNLREEDRRELVEKHFDLLVKNKIDSTGVGQLRHLAYTRDPAYIPRLRQLFDNAWPHKRRVVNEDLPGIENRDAALSMCIALSGQDPTEYGFTAQEKATAKDRLRYWADNYYFDGRDAEAVEAKRVAAFKKWAEWEKANPEKLKAKASEKK